MVRDTSVSEEGRWRPLLRRADQITVGALVAICLAAILLHWVWQLAFGASLIYIDEAPALQLDFVVQVNEAEWPELTLLPKIGKTLAQRIVQYRQEHGPFQSVDQLSEVKGIGPKTVRRLRPYVRID